MKRKKIIPLLIIMGYISFNNSTTYLSNNIVKGTPANSVFDDDKLYNCIIDNYNSELNASKEYSYNLTIEELNNITVLNCSSKDIVNITGIEKLPNLVSIDLSKNKIENISFLINNQYDNITSINLNSNNIGGYLAWKQSFFPNLANINLKNNKITGIELPSTVTNVTISNNANNFTNICSLSQITLCENNSIVLKYYNNSKDYYYTENRTEKFREPSIPTGPKDYIFDGWYYDDPLSDSNDSTNFKKFFNFSTEEENTAFFTELVSHNISEINLYAIWKKAVSNNNYVTCNILLGDNYVCDINQDKIINSGDAVNTLRNVVNSEMYNNLSSLQLSLMDSNWDQEINTGDVSALLKYLLSTTNISSLTGNQKKAIARFMASSNIEDKMFKLVGALSSLDTEISDECLFGDYTKKCHTTSCSINTSHPYWSVEDDEGYGPYSKYDYDKDGDFDICDSDALLKQNGYTANSIKVGNYAENIEEDTSNNDSSNNSSEISTNPQTSDLSIILILVTGFLSIIVVTIMYNKKHKVTN